MWAMQLERIGAPLVAVERADPVAGPGAVAINVTACGVCRTDLHVVDGDLPDPVLPIVPGHEIVGRVSELGAGVTGFQIGERVGVGWLGATCSHCAFCREGRENLCDAPAFTGFTATAASPPTRSPMPATSIRSARRARTRRWRHCSAPG